VLDLPPLPRASFCHDSVGFLNIFITVIFENIKVPDWLSLGIEYLINNAHICSFKMFS
jgi:hypothetical protein